METLETIARRIETTQDLQSLVRSMKTLSAIGVRHLEQAEAALRHFRRTIDMGLQVVLGKHSLRHAPRKAAGGAQVLVVFGSDRGLCAGFNETIAELASRHVAREALAREQFHVMAVGTLAATRLEALGLAPDAVVQTAGSVKGLAEICERILIRLDELQLSRGVQSVATMFNRRDAEGDVAPSAHVLLPIALDRLRSLERAPWPSRRLPAFAVAPEALFSWLVRQHLLADLYHAALSSMAAENSARLMAMQRAERNMNGKLEAMQAEFRRLRQDAITTELMDIAGSYEVLRSGSA
jgi:F-type H+-transporting ATPase subunit gamma